MTLTSHAFRAALLFAGAGAICRFLLRTVETRWQIVGFWGAVLAYQFVLRPAAGRRISVLSAAIDIVAITVAIVAMKIAIEGKITH